MNLLFFFNPFVVLFQTLGHGSLPARQTKTGPVAASPRDHGPKSLTQTIIQSRTVPYFIFKIIAAAVL